MNINFTFYKFTYYLFFFLPLGVFAQPTVIGTQLVDGSYQTYNLSSIGSFKQYRLQAGTSASVSLRNWEFATGTDASTDYSTNWRPYTGGNTLSVNTFIPTNYANAAKYNTGSGGASGLLPAIISGNYYTFNVSNNASSDNVMQLLETTYNPVVISAVSQSVGASGVETISITTSGTPDASEYIYVRFSTNNYSTSTLIQATGSGTSWSADIPWQSSAVSYYVYTSNKLLSQINNDVSTYGQGAHDMSTLNLNNNAGSNYSWSFGNFIVKSTGGTSANGASYTSLTNASGVFAALNAGTAHTGTVTVFVCGNSTSEAGTNTLINSSAWTSATMYPINTGLTISGNVTLALIDFAGADNFTLDGRLNATGSTPDLTICNLSTSNTSGTCTIRIYNASNNNNIQYCKILGSTTSTTNGIITFGTTASTGNTIGYNKITNSGTNRPINAIYSVTTVANEVVVRNNEIYDYINQGVTSAGVYLLGVTSTSKVINNSFFETTNFVQTNITTNNYYAIYINTTSAGLDISGNFIGGSAAQCGGSTSWRKTNANNSHFQGMNVTVGTGTPTTILNNTIQNFSWSNSSNGQWIGIYLLGGDATIGSSGNPNIIGSNTGTGSVVFNSGASTTLYCIVLAGTGFINCSYNNIGSFLLNSTSLSQNFIGIFRNNTNAKCIISNNIIGSTVTSNSVNCSSTGSTTSQSVAGIYNSGTASVSLSILNNTIVNLTNGTTNSTTSITGYTCGIMLLGNAVMNISGNTIRDLSIANTNTDLTHLNSISGISLSTNCSSTDTISNNTIYSLYNTNSSFTGTISGIYANCGGSGLSKVGNNYIYNLSAPNSSGANIYGIRKNHGYNFLYNNIINLGSNIPATIYGIYEDASFSGSLTNSYFNTIYIGGSPTSGSLNSYAVYSNSLTNAASYKNNIISNFRTNNGATGYNYGMYLNFSANSSYGYWYQYNNIYVNTSLNSGGMLGYNIFNGGNTPSLPIVPTENDVSQTPSFYNPGGTNTTDYVSQNSTSGTTISAFNTDFTGTTRANPPTNGAYEAPTSRFDIYSGVTFGATYPSLQTAFSAINNGIHTGILTIRMKSTSIETATAVLNASGTNGGIGTSSYSSVTLYPIYTGLNIKAITNINTALINLNGADNVTIDGRVNGTGSTIDLTIDNASNGNVATENTIQFIGGATSNTIKYCTIKGSTRTATTGTILLSTGTNTSNTLDHNKFTNSGGNIPVNVIYSNTTGNQIDITNNEFYDIYNLTSTYDFGINFAFSPADTHITGNSFYQTTATSPTSNSATFTAIYVNALTSNLWIDNNYIGGSAVNCSGSWIKNATNNQQFTGIQCIGSAGSGKTISISNNTIAGFSWANNGVSFWKGILLQDGSSVLTNTVSNNIIGSNTGTGNIQFTANGAGSYLAAICLGTIGGATTPIINCNSNQIGSISTSNTTQAANTDIIGIKRSNTGTTNINSNIIGSSSTVNSINASSASTTSAQLVVGIENNNTGSLTTNSNTISNLTNGTTNSSSGVAGYSVGILNNANATFTSNGNTIHDLSIGNANTSASQTASISGISVTSSSTSLTTVNTNTIYNLTNSNATFAGYIRGIYFYGGSGANDCSANTIYALSASGATIGATTLSGIVFNAGIGSNTISKNYIYGFTASNSSNGVYYGVSKQSGVVTISNNIVNLGGSSQTSIYGFYDAGTATNTTNFYFNTIYIGGTVSSGTTTSYCLYSAAANNSRNFRNNIFSNVRSTIGGASLHYAVFLTSNSNLTCNYNDYYVTGTGGILGNIGGNDKNSLSLWKIATSQDVYSYSVNPDFTNAGTNTTTDYQIGKDLAGVSATGITTDFGVVTRATVPTMGAWERANMLNRWKGISTDWNTASNWTLNTLPSTDANLNFDYEPQNNCLLDADHSVTNISNATTNNVVTNGHKLTIKGTIDQTSTGKIDASGEGSTIEFAGGSLQNIPVSTFTNNQIYNLRINNLSNVIINGTVSILNNLTALSGKLDAITNSPNITLSGVTPQTLDNSVFLNSKVYDLTIDNTASVTLSTDLLVNNSLTVNSGGELIIPTTKLMNVEGVINNTSNTGIIIKASVDGSTANGSLIYHNSAEVPVSATVEMYDKSTIVNPSGSTTNASNYRWQYFGIPVKTVTPTGTFDGPYVRRWNHPTASWVLLQNSSVLTSFTGYEIAQPQARTITYQGYLENSDYSTTLDAKDGTTNAGQYLFSNPYTAAIDIKLLTFGAQTDNSVYLFNTGSSADWSTNGSTYDPGNNAGQYVVCPVFTAGIGGIPRQIPSMQGFVVKDMATAGDHTFGIPYSSVMQNSSPLRAPNSTGGASTNFTTIDIKGSRFADRMWIITNPFCTHGFDNGWDGRKLSGTVLTPQLYASEPDGNYQVNAVNDINNTDLGFQAGEDTNYTLTFRHEYNEKPFSTLYLIDLIENKTTDITQSGSEYNFSTTSSIPIKRFKIVTTPDISTKKEDFINNSLSIFSVENKLLIRNYGLTGGHLILYDLNGKMVHESPISPSGITTIPTQLTDGFYVAKAKTDNEELTVKVSLNKSVQ